MTDQYDYKADAQRLGRELEELRNHLALTELSPNEVRKRLSTLIEASEGEDGPLVDGWIGEELKGMRKKILDAMEKNATVRMRELTSILKHIDNLQGVDQ